MKIRCKKKQCREHAAQVIELSRRCDNYCKLLNELTEKLEVRVANQNLDIKMMEAKERFLRSVGQMNESAAKIITPGAF